MTTFPYVTAWACGAFPAFCQMMSAAPELEDVVLHGASQLDGVSQGPDLLIPFRPFMDEWRAVAAREADRVGRLSMALYYGCHWLPVPSLNECKQSLDEEQVKRLAQLVELSRTSRGWKLSMVLDRFVCEAAGVDMAWRQGESEAVVTAFTGQARLSLFHRWGHEHFDGLPVSVGALDYLTSLAGPINGSVRKWRASPSLTGEVAGSLSASVMEHRVSGWPSDFALPPRNFYTAERWHRWAHERDLRPLELTEAG